MVVTRALLPKEVARYRLRRTTRGPEDAEDSEDTEELEPLDDDRLPADSEPLDEEPAGAQHVEWHFSGWHFVLLSVLVACTQLTLTQNEAQDTWRTTGVDDEPDELPLLEDKGSAG